MKVVKLTTPWKHPFFIKQVNPGIENFVFEIDNDCSKCDYWIIWGDLPEPIEKMSVICPPGNTIFMTDEAFVEKTFDQLFLNQFEAVISCRNDITHRKLIKTHEINTWHLKKAFKDVYNRRPIEKTKLLSVVCSDLTFLPGHKKRYAFVNKLIGHFKDRLDVFGRGFSPIDDKWEALAPYKYSIAIENSSINGYFTEKLTECYLAHTFPIYFGAPDIFKYFDESSIMIINIDDYKESINKIEMLLEQDPWAARQSQLIDQKMLYLTNYQLFSALSKLLFNFEDCREKPKLRTIKSHKTFSQYYHAKKLYSTAKRLFQ